MAEVDTDALVVGAGPVGLALAIELGMRGVRVLVAERNPRGGTAPRAQTTNVRTRTRLRRWGIADRLAEASPLGVGYPNDVQFVTSLAGHRLAHKIQRAKIPFLVVTAGWSPAFEASGDVVAAAGGGRRAVVKSPHHFPQLVSDEFNQILEAFMTESSRR